MTVYVPPLPKQNFVPKQLPAVTANWLNVVDGIVQGLVPGSGVYSPTFQSGYVQYIGSDGNIHSNTNFIFGLALPNATGIPAPCLLLGSGVPQAGIICDAVLAGTPGINLLMEAGDAASPSSDIGGQLSLYGGAGYNGKGGKVLIQAGTSLNAIAGDTYVQGGNGTSASATAGNVYVSGGLSGPVGGGSVHLIMTDTASGVNVGSIVFRVNSTVLWTINNSGALFLGATGAGQVGQVLSSQGPNALPIWAPPNVSTTRTLAEQSLGVFPVNFNYPADPYVDPRRYGADNTNNSTASVVTTTTNAVQTAINVAHSAGTAVILNGLFQINPVSIVLGGAPDRFRIFGTSVVSSGLVAAAGQPAGALLTIAAAGYPGQDFQANLILEKFSVQPAAGIGKTAGVNGISLQGLAYVHVSGVRVSGFDVGLDMPNLETSVIDDNSQIVSNNTGIKIYLVGTSQTTNLIKINDCILTGNSSAGIDYNGGTGFFVTGCDLEANGTTNNTATGAIFIRSALSPDAGRAHVVISNNWFESNHGWAVNVAAPLNTDLRLRISDCEFLAGENGQEINILGGYQILMENLESKVPDSGPVVGSTYNVTATKAVLINVAATHLNTAGVTTLTII